MKVVYHFGTEINAQTIVKKGLLQTESIPFQLICDGKTYVFDQVKSVCITKECGGTMVRVENGKDSIFLMVPRLFINLGTGFLIVNYFATKRLKKRFSDPKIKEYTLNKMLAENCAKLCTFDHNTKVFGNYFVEIEYNGEKHSFVTDRGEILHNGKTVVPYCAGDTFPTLFRTIQTELFQNND